MNGGSLIILVAMFAVLWAVLIRPQKAKQKRQQQMLSEIGPGDEVLTVGGIYGIVQEVDEDDDLIVEIADGIHVRIARRAIGTVVSPDDDDAEVGDGASDEESAQGEPHEAQGPVTVPDEEASLEATEKRLSGGA